jgi:hypothetical protein
VAAKWSVGLLIKDHVDTFVNEQTAKPRWQDYFAFFCFPIIIGVMSYGTGFRLEDADGILAGTVIFTGLLFALVIHVFGLGLRMTDDPRITRGSRVSRLVDQLQANVLYSVLIGILTTVVLVVAAGTTQSGHSVGVIMTAIIAIVLSHLLATMLMILKRMRATYREFRR